ncbi:MAG: hypothetical protein KC503_45630 [Myxococcales bacterium]|nr:hypothetical protein [Myxococcales bacterium]
MKFAVRRAAFLAALALLFVSWQGARAEAPANNVFSALARTLSDPQRKVVMAKDRSVLFILSPKGEISVGAGGQIKTHAPGAIKIRHDLTQGVAGVKISMAEALGHQGQASVRDLAAIGKLLASNRINVSMRRNQIGFNSKTYADHERPLDILASRGKAHVTPDGKIKLPPRTARVPIGFRTPRKTAR